MWKWKVLYWLVVYFVPPLLGVVLDKYLGLQEVPWLTPLGIVLILIAIVLSSGAGRALRLCGHSKETRRFTPPDKLVTKGPYSCMRHPNQFGSSLMPLALALLLGSPCALALAGWGVALGLTFILYFEERLVHKEFYPEYCDYASEVPAISLNPVCLKEAIRALKGGLKC